MSYSSGYGHLLIFYFINIVKYSACNISQSDFIFKAKKSDKKSSGSDVKKSAKKSESRNSPDDGALELHSTERFDSPAGSPKPREDINSKMPFTAGGGGM